MPRQITILPPVTEISPTGSHSDSNVPFTSIHTPLHPSQCHREPDDSPIPPQNPRPRISLQIYYVAPDAGSPEVVTDVASALHTQVLKERGQGDDYTTNDRLDVYGIPGGDAASCVRHQRAEIEARRGKEREWYMQRFDLGIGRGRNGWRRGTVIVKGPMAGWEKEGRLDMEIVYFEPVVGDQKGQGVSRDGAVGEMRVQSTVSGEDELIAVKDLRYEVNWEHTAWQFYD